MNEGKSRIKKQTYYDTDHSLHPKLVEYYYSQFGEVDKVLDLGCGTGNLGKYKPLDSIEVYGLDIDSGAIELAQEYEIAEVHDLAEEPLPYDDDFFGAVLAKDILEHLEQPWQLVDEIYRVLKPQGVVVASVPLPRPKVVWGDYTHIRGFTGKTIKTMFKDHGFEVEHLRKWGGIPGIGRLGLITWIPYLLKIPLFDFFFSSSWEIKCLKREGGSKV